jgi:hypothetical protein
MENVGIFYDYLENFTPIWYNLCMAVGYGMWSFGIFLPIWYVWTKKNLATLKWRKEEGAAVACSDGLTDRVTGWVCEKTAQNFHT